MLSYLKEILRGVFIGVANIIPGVSGGTLAVSMGVYSKIIDAINNIKKDFISDEELYVIVERTLFEQQHQKSV